MTTVLVKPDRVKKLRNQYPWLYADEIDAIRGEPHAGELVELQDTRGEFIARAFFNPTSHIAARIESLIHPNDFIVKNRSRLVTQCKKVRATLIADGE